MAQMRFFSEQKLSRNMSIGTMLLRTLRKAAMKAAITSLRQRQVLDYLRRRISTDHKMEVLRAQASHLVRVEE